jgi:hypothetical protein
LDTPIGGAQALSVLHAMSVARFMSADGTWRT